MTLDPKGKTWALLKEADYTANIVTLSAKHRSQVTRKVTDLMDNPHPGGSKIALTGYEDLFRLRAGDYRIIYTYDDVAVYLITLRRRNEKTYDVLDDLEVQQINALKLRPKRKSPEERQADWDKVALERAAPRAKPSRKLPEPITPAILTKLNIPSGYHEALMKVRSDDELLDCEAVPDCYREQLMEVLFPKVDKFVEAKPTPVVVMEDLVDDKAAAVTGPIDAGQATDTIEKTAVMPDILESPIMSKSKAIVRVRPLLVQSLRRQEPMTPFRGNAGRGVGKEARYRVKLNGTIELTYEVGDSEWALLSTDAHAGLVTMVNDAKKAGGSGPGGSFLINEYRQVIVPTIGGTVIYAGTYTRDLEFEFEDTLITPVAPSRIKPGDEWPGPHVGIRYKVAAGCSNIRYEYQTERGTIKEVSLTDKISAGEAAPVLDMIRAVKPQGGRLYINEAREFFAPVGDQDKLKYCYIGHLGTKPWFPEPA